MRIPQKVTNKKVKEVHLSFFFIYLDSIKLKLVFPLKLKV